MAVALVALAAACGADTETVPPPLFTAPATPVQTTTGATSEPPAASASTTPPPPASTFGPTPQPTSAGAWPPYTSSIEPVTGERLGPTWQPGCPVGPEELRLVSVTYATYDETAQTGELVVAAAGAEEIVAVFAEIYAARFPITRMETIEVYGGDDDASMAADNSSAFNCRPVTGGDGWSRHAYGLAVDINPLRNPYVQGTTVLPPAGEAYLDRSDVRPGMIVAGDVVVAAFAARGFEWGGAFSSLKDYQHFDR